MNSRTVATGWKPGANNLSILQCTSFKTSEIINNIMYSYCMLHNIPCVSKLIYTYQAGNLKLFNFRPWRKATVLIINFRRRWIGVVESVGNISSNLSKLFFVKKNLYQECWRQNLEQLSLESVWCTQWASFFKLNKWYWHAFSNYRFWPCAGLP